MSRTSAKLLALSTTTATGSLLAKRRSLPVGVGLTSPGPSGPVGQTTTTSCPARAAESAISCAIAFVCA
jgi:hypothetical protein